jgi:hypothetical protein
LATVGWRRAQLGEAVGSTTGFGGSRVGLGVDQQLSIPERTDGSHGCVIAARLPGPRIRQIAALEKRGGRQLQGADGGVHFASSSVAADGPTQSASAPRRDVVPEHARTGLPTTRTGASIRNQQYEIGAQRHLACAYVQAGIDTQRYRQTAQATELVKLSYARDALSRGTVTHKGPTLAQSLALALSGAAIGIYGLIRRHERLGQSRRRYADRQEPVMFVGGSCLPSAR